MHEILVVILWSMKSVSREKEEYNKQILVSWWHACGGCPCICMHGKKRNKDAAKPSHGRALRCVLLPALPTHTPPCVHIQNITLAVMCFLSHPVAYVLSTPQTRGSKYYNTFLLLFRALCSIQQPNIWKRNSKKRKYTQCRENQVAYVSTLEFRFCEVGISNDKTAKRDV